MNIKQIKKEVKICLFAFLLITIAFQVNIFTCSATAECERGLAWCETWGNCGEDPPVCIGLDGEGVMCECNGVIQSHDCDPEA